MRGQKSTPSSTPSYPPAAACLLVAQAQKERGDAREAAALIKRMVQFNQLVVTPMLDRLKGLSAAEVEVRGAACIWASA